LLTGGGDCVNHSSVLAFQGLGPAFALLDRTHDARHDEPDAGGEDARVDRRNQVVADAVSAVRVRARGCNPVRMTVTSRRTAALDGRVLAAVRAWRESLGGRPPRWPASQPAVLSRDLHGLGAVAHAQLAQDLRHAVAEGALGQPHARRDLGGR